MNKLAGETTFILFTYKPFYKKECHKYRYLLLLNPITFKSMFFYIIDMQTSKIGLISFFLHIFCWEIFTHCQLGLFYNSKRLFITLILTFKDFSDNDRVTVATPIFIFIFITITIIDFLFIMTIIVLHVS